jgi:hypothetical protein
MQRSRPLYLYRYRLPKCTSEKVPSSAAPRRPTPYRHRSPETEASVALRPRPQPPYPAGPRRTGSRAHYPAGPTTPPGPLPAGAHCRRGLTAGGGSLHRRGPHWRLGVGKPEQCLRSGNGRPAWARSGRGTSPTVLSDAPTTNCSAFWPWPEVQAKSAVLKAALGPHGNPMAAKSDLGPRLRALTTAVLRETRTDFPDTKVFTALSVGPSAMRLY